MTNDRLLNILRWVVTPIVLAIIAGYFQSRVNTAKEQTRASYDTLAPNVLELQYSVAVLTGRLEELSKKPAPCTEPTKPVRVEAPKPHPVGIIGLGGKTEVMMDSPAQMHAPAKLPARFDDLIQQQAK